ncbi:MAG: hypothetical protein ACE5G5_09080 [Candidatus Methylomirabilales bacterium]
MVKIRLRRSILIGGAVFSFFLLNAPRVSAGWGQVLTDAELDAIYAQGLSIVDISFGKGLLNFSSRTKIEFPEIPIPNAGAKIDFLGGLFSVLADPPAPSNQASNQGTSGLILPPIRARLSNPGGGGSNPAPSQASNQGTSGLNPPSGQTSPNPGGSGSNPSGTQPSNSPPVVTVTFGDGKGRGIGSSVLSITAKGVNVNSVVNIRFGRDPISSRSTVQGVIRSAMGAF